MNALVRCARALVGLFFDDGKLALGLLVLLACAAVVANFEATGSSLAMVLLVGGTLMLLLENVTRTARSTMKSVLLCARRHHGTTSGVSPDRRLATCTSN